MGNVGITLVEGNTASGAVLTSGLQSTRTAGTITTAVSVVGPVQVADHNVATVTVSGTHAGVNLTFEASDDGTNWFGVNGAQTDAFSAGPTTGVITSNATRAWDIALGAFTQFRVRATGWTSGSAAVGITAQAGPYDPSPSVGVVGTVPVSGTVAVTGSLTSAGTVSNTPVSGAGSGINFAIAATNNLALQKASAGSLMTLNITNLSTGAVYVKMYNTATVPTMGTTAANFSIPVAAGQFLPIEFGAVGLKFSAGLYLAVTNAASLTDNTAVAATAGGWVTGTYI